MGENNNSIQWDKLNTYKKAFIESLEPGNQRTWLLMYFSGKTIDEIAEECACSKTRIRVSLNNSIEKYNQFFFREKSKKDAAKVAAEISKIKKDVPKTSARYRPKKQSQRVYTKLRKRIEAQFDKKFYIGDINVNQEEYDELLEYTRWQLQHLPAGGAALKDSPVLAVALVQIGIRCYNGNYWGNALKQELKTENSPAFQRFLGESFVRTLKKHNKYILDESERVQSILFHSFVTDYYSKGLFELLFQYYANDLERDIYRNDKNQMQSLMETIQLKAAMSEEESEAFTSQFTGRGSRAYKLRQHTLQAITANPSHSSTRLRRILRMMDKAFWKDSVPQRPVSRLTILFLEWLKESPSFKKEYKLYKSGEIRNRGKKHFSSPYLFANILNTKFSLVLPSQIVRQELAERLYWYVTVNGELIKTPVISYPVLTGYKTEEKRIPLSTDQLFSEISCQLRNSTDILRSFSPLPLSDARMFDMEGDYSTRIFKIPMCVYTRNGISLKSPALLDKVPLGPVTRWDLEFVDGDILIFSDGKSLVAGERYVDGLTKRGIVDGASHTGRNGNAVAVYNRLPDLLLTLPKAKTAGTVLDINGVRHRLSDCKTDEFESGDARGVQAFLVQMSQFRECSPNAQSRVFIDVPGGPYAREFSFVYIPDLKAQFDGAPYVFEERGTLVFPDDIQAECADETAESLRGENGFQFQLSQTLRSISVKINQSILIDFYVPVFMWSYDEEEWQTEPMGDIWHQDFKSHRRLFFRSPSNRLEFGTDDDYDDSDDELEQHSVSCEKRSDGVFVLDLTRFHSWITRERVAHVIQMRLGSNSYEFARVYARSYVNSCDLLADYKTGQLRCTGEFIGRGDYYVDITHLQSGLKIAEKGPIHNGELLLKTRLRNGEYQVDFYETEEDDDLFDDVSYLPVHSFKKSLINPDDLSGNSVRILSYRRKFYAVMHTRLATPLIVNDLEILEPGVYEGNMHLAEGKDLRVKIVFENENNLRYFYLYYWDDYDEAFVEFLFDSQEKTLVLTEEPGLKQSVRYRRYTVLYDTDFLLYGSVEEHS